MTNDKFYTYHFFLTGLPDPRSTLKHLLMFFYFQMALDPSKALTKNRVDIIKNVANPNEVADYLYSYGIFTEDMKASVEVCKYSVSLKLFIQ